MISAEEFVEWKEHPVTKEIFNELKKVKASMIDQLTNGNTIGLDADATHGLTNRVIGHLDGINQLLNITYETVETQDEVSDQSGY